MDNEQEERIESFRQSVIHGLRSQGWSRIDAENEADNRAEKWRQKSSVVSMNDCDAVGHVVYTFGYVSDHDGDAK